ncbi:MAG: hypothetical protein ACYSWU_08330 [Planctomycetota bacterium]
MTADVPSFVNCARLLGEVTEAPVDVMVATQVRMFTGRWCSPASAMTKWSDRQPRTFHGSQQTVAILKTAGYRTVVGGPPRRLRR